jgi:hypothetical protein
VRKALSIPPTAPAPNIIQNIIASDIKVLRSYSPLCALNIRRHEAWV